jgi:hypothetical protein
MAARKTRPPGRSKGSKNLVGATAKENILAVFTRLGGTAAMAEWAGENRTEFYRLYARLIPTEGGTSVNGTIIVEERDPTVREPGYNRRGTVSCESVVQGSPAARE